MRGAAKRYAIPSPCVHSLSLTNRPLTVTKRTTMATTNRNPAPSGAPIKNPMAAPPRIPQTPVTPNKIQNLRGRRSFLIIPEVGHSSYLFPLGPSLCVGLHLPALARCSSRLPTKQNQQSKKDE